MLTNRNAMNAVGMLLGTVLGSATVVDGLAIAPTAPASLQVQVGQGAIYALAPVDPNAYSSLPADAADTIVKQGLVFGTTILTLTPPAASGQSQVYLVQAAFQEVDGGSTLLPYYNASAPTQPWQGPNNGGTSQFTLRQGVCVIGLKAGVAGPTGSQATPAPDAGYVGLYAITVANGAASVGAGNIATLASAPFVNAKLPALGGVVAAAGLNPNPADPTQFLVALQVLFRGKNRVSYYTGGSYSWTVPAGVTRVLIKVVGGGGSGGSGPNNYYGGSGGGGGIEENWFAVTPGQVLSIAVGAGAPATNGIQPGFNGATSGVSGLLAATGGLGGGGSGSSSLAGGISGYGTYYGQGLGDGDTGGSETSGAFCPGKGGGPGGQAGSQGGYGGKGSGGGGGGSGNGYPSGGGHDGCVIIDY